MATYKDFLEAISQNDDERRKREEQERQARIEDLKKRESAEKDKSIGDRIGDFFGGIGDFAVDTGKGIVDAAVSIPKTVVKTIDAGLNEDRINKDLQSLDADYKSGKINRQELEEKVNAITENVIGARAVATDEGVGTKSEGETVKDFAKGFTDAGVKTASVLPVGRGVKFGFDAAGKAFAGDTVGQFAKRAAINSGQQAAVQGSADTLNQALQGDEINPLTLAANFVAPAALGAAGDVAGYGAKRAIDSSARSIAEFNALPRAVREGGYIKVPGADDVPATAAPDPVRDLASQAIPEVPTQEAAPTPSLLDPTPALRTDTPEIAPNGATVNNGVQYKSREQIIDDNKGNRPFLAKAYEQFIDANAPLKDLGKEYKRVTGKMLDVDNDPHALSQLRNGMDEAAASRYSGLVGSFKYLRDNNLSEQMKQYGIANQVVNDRASVYGPETVAAERAKMAKIEAELSPEDLAAVKGAVQEAIDLQDNYLQRYRDEGFISQEAYDAIKEVNPNYFTRFNLAEYIDGNQRLLASSNSKNISNNLVKAVKGMGDDRNIVIEDPIEAIVRSGLKMENQIQNNKVFHAAQRLSETLPEMVIKGRTADDVLARMSLASDNKELRPIRNSLDRLIKRDNKAVRTLQTQINNLEKKGLDVSLKNGGQRMNVSDLTVGQLEKLGGDVPTSRTGQLDPNATDEFTQLVKDSTMATKRGSANAQGLRDETIIEGAGTKAQTTGSSLSEQDTNAFIRSLVENNSRSEIDALKRQVNSRDAKVNALFDEIGAARSQYEDVTGTIKANADEIRAKGDLDAPEGYEAVNGYTDGVKETLFLPSYIADAWKGKNDIQAGVMEQVMQAGSKTFKPAATILSPAFLVKNSIRDTGTHWLTSENISKSERLLILPYAKRWVEGFMSSLGSEWLGGDPALAKRLTEAGMGAAGIFNDRGDTSKIVRDVAKNITGVEVKTPSNMFKTAAKMIGDKTGISKIAQGYVSGMQKAGRALEYAPRIAEAKAAIERGASDPAAALAGRQALGDLQNGGTVSRLLNNYVPFTNSIIQGNSRIVQAAAKNPADFAMMATAGIAMPAITGYLWNRTMYPDVLDNMSEYDREANFVIILGDEKDDEGRYTNIIKIPKNDAAKMLGNNMEAVMAQFAGEDPQSFAELFMKSIGYAQPIQIEKDGVLSRDALVNSTIGANPLVKVPIELATNKSLFTGQDITPENLQGLDAADQVKANTPEIDKLVSAGTQVLPGEMKLNPLEAGAARQGVSAGLVGSNPLDQVKNAVTGSSSTRGAAEFYKLRQTVANEKKRASNAVNKAIEAGDLEAAQDIAMRYAQKFESIFDPWVVKYGETANDDMIEAFESLKLVLSNRSIKQREKNIQKRQASVQ